MEGTCTHSTRRQAGSGREGTKEKARRAMGGEARGVCGGHCRGVRDGSALGKEQADPRKKIRTPAGMRSPPELASQAEAREFPLSSWVAGEAADSQT